MNKLLILAVTAVLAAAALPIQPSTAEARGIRLFRHHGGGLLRPHRLFRHHHHRHHLFGHHHHRRRLIVPVPVPVGPAIVAPAVVAPAFRPPVAMPAQVAPTQVAARNNDDMGRKFDPASMSWFDGTNQCWQGKQPWSFRSGSWLYGTNRWYPANGTWVTDASEAPTPVDCQNIPAFAQARPPTTQGVVGNRPSDEGVTESSGGCTRYSPHIGRVIPVPCGS